MKPFVTEKMRKFIRKQEGWSAVDYDDAGLRSIGYGHLIKPGEEYLLNRKITRAEGEAFLEKDIASHQKPWIGLLGENATEDQVLALTSFAYNLGAGRPALKTAARLINEGKTEEAGALLKKYNKWRPKGKGTPLVVHKGLTERRAFEAGLISGKGYDFGKDIIGTNYAAFGRDLQGNLASKTTVTTPQSQAVSATSPGELPTGMSNMTMEQMIRENQRIGGLKKALLVT